jgi:hypothetical protein
MARSNDVTFEVVKELGVLSEGSKGWTRQVNLVSWNGKSPKLEIRDWNEDRTKMGKACPLDYEEVQLLKALLNEKEDELDF